MLIFWTVNSWRQKAINFSSSVRRKTDQTKIYARKQGFGSESNYHTVDNNMAFQLCWNTLLLLIKLNHISYANVFSSGQISILNVLNNNLIITKTNQPAFHRNSDFTSMLYLRMMWKWCIHFLCLRQCFNRKSYINWINKKLN